MADLFGTQEVDVNSKLAQSNETPMQGVQDTSAATRIGAYDRIPGVIADVMAPDPRAERAQNIANADQSMLNLDRTLRKIQDAKNSGGLTVDQANIRSQDIIDRFAADNPHLLPKMKEMFKQNKETFKTASDAFNGNDVEKAQAQATQDLVNQAVKLGQMNEGETDPNKIHRAIGNVQAINAAAEQLKTANDNQTYRNNVLAQKAAEQGIVLGNISIDQRTMELQEMQKKVAANNAAQAITLGGIGATQNFIETMLPKIELAKNDPKALAALQTEIDAYEASHQQTIAQIPTSLYMSPDVKQGAVSALTNQLDPIRKLIKGDHTKEQATNYVETATTLAQAAAVSDPRTGKQLLASNAFFKLVGPAAANINQIQTLATEMFANADLDAKTGAPTPTVSTLGDTESAKVYRDKFLPAIEATAGKVVGKIATEDDKKMALAGVDTSIKGAAMAPQGTSPKNWAPNIHSWASDNFGAYMEKEKPPLDASTVAQANANMMQQYGDPASKVLRQKLSVLGPDVEKYFSITWGAKGIEVAPQPTLNGTDLVKAKMAIQDVNPMLGGMTDLVKANAHLHGNRDYGASLEQSLPTFFNANPQKMVTPDNASAIASQITNDPMANFIADAAAERTKAQKEAIASLRSGVLGAGEAKLSFQERIDKRMSEWDSNMGMSGDFLDKVKAYQANPTQKQIVAPAMHTASPTEPAPVEQPTTASPDISKTGTVRVAGQNYEAPDEASVRALAEAERMTPTETQLLVDQWKESMAQKERQATGQRVTKGK